MEKIIKLLKEEGFIKHLRFTFNLVPEGTEEQRKDFIAERLCDLCAKDEEIGIAVIHWAVSEIVEKVYPEITKEVIKTDEEFDDLLKCVRNIVNRYCDKK